MRSARIVYRHHHQSHQRKHLASHRRARRRSRIALGIIARRALNAIIGIIAGTAARSHPGRARLTLRETGARGMSRSISASLITRLSLSSYVGGISRRHRVG